MLTGFCAEVKRCKCAYQHYASTQKDCSPFFLVRQNLCLLSSNQNKLFEFVMCAKMMLGMFHCFLSMTTGGGKLERQERVVSLSRPPPLSPTGYQPLPTMLIRGRVTWFCDIAVGGVK